MTRNKPEIVEKLADPSYKAKIERAMILHVDAIDWNCPQHISQRFTMEEIEILNSSVYDHAKKIEAEIEMLKAKIGKWWLVSRLVSLFTSVFIYNSNPATEER